MNKISSLAPFIEKGIYTVPLNGSKIARDDKGKKHGFSFPSDWQKTHSATLNETATAIGGLLTGKDGLVAIDCDDFKTYTLFRTLDPEYTAYFDSIGKLDPQGNPLECGTILYKHTEQAPDSFRSTSGYDLDYYSGTGLVFLPTEKNETKTTWYADDNHLYNHKQELVEFKPLPELVIQLLALIHGQHQPNTTTATDTHKRGRGFLGRVLIEEEMIKDIYIPNYFKLLTPQEYRSTIYNNQGHLHPNDIQGSGHTYLFKIACRLAGDNTVSPDLFRATMDYISNLWDNPYPASQLEKTIVAPIVSGRQTNSDGEPYWEYDEEWEQQSGFYLVDKRDSALTHIFYDEQQKATYIHNTLLDKHTYIEKPSALLAHLQMTCGLYDSKELAQQIDVINTYARPNEDYGLSDDRREFNVFKPTEELLILRKPELHTKYKKPDEFIAYMEHFIPSEEQRSYLLRLLRTKLTTFGYSPVVPYIIGVQGSGKDTIVDIASHILGLSYVAKGIDAKVWLEKHNGWLRNKYIVQLNELGDTIGNPQDRKRAVGILKNYTGSKTFECRSMGIDAYQYPQTAMFILTANSSPLTIDDTDRRLFYVNTPNTFASSSQCLASDPTVIHRAIMSQIKDIAYYLSTEYTNLQGHEYINAPHTEGRGEMIFMSQTYSDKIAWALKQGEFDLLYEWLIVPQDIFYINEERPDSLTLNDLVKAYYHHAGDIKGDGEHIMKSAMKKQHFKYANEFYTIPNLTAYDGSMIDSDEEDIELPNIREPREEGL